MIHTSETPAPSHTAGMVASTSARPTGAPLPVTPEGAERLRTALEGKLLVLCFGSGVDSTAMLVALHEVGIRPDVITFADTGGEKPETIMHIERINVVLTTWEWPRIEVCRATPRPTTPYTDLYGNCIANETLPSLAFGMKSCSIKWKQVPQDQHIRGVKSGPNAKPPHALWDLAERTNRRIVKLIGYDCGKADVRRSQGSIPADSPFDYVYPLQLIGWARSDCVSAIAAAIGADMVPIKSACFFCPASKHWELYWLAAKHPDLFERSLQLERNALTGRHSRFSVVEFGASWEEMVASGTRFPSTKSCVGLGRSFSWNQWALMNNVVDSEFKVIQRDAERFIAMSDALRAPDNALDGRSTARGTNGQHELFEASV